MLGRAGVQGLLQRIENEVRARGVALPPADDPASADVHHKGHVLAALPGRETREVRHPQLVESIRLELPIDPVQRTYSLRITWRGAHEFVTPDAFQTRTPH